MVRFEKDRLWLITAAGAELHDGELLRARLPDDGSVSCVNRTADYGALIVAGPRSRTILAAVSDADLSGPWLTHQPASVAGHDAHLIRVSFTGELGWEIHASPDAMPAIYAALFDAGAPHGLQPFGMYALDSLRMEKGYRTWKGDLSSDYSMLEGALDRFVKFDKDDFPGKSALLREQHNGSQKRFATLLVEAGEYDAPYMSTLWHGDDKVGESTSGNWGHRIDRSMAFAVVRADLAAPGTALEIEIFGERYAATVQPEQALWDPDNERLRC